MRSGANEERFPSRKHPRLKAYDYSTPNYYFVTICTWQKLCLFGSPEKLNFRGEIARSGLLGIEKHFPNVRVDKYVIMPNHIHVILDLHTKGASLPDILGQYKAFVTKEIHREEPGRKIWQTSFHEHIIRSQQAYETIWLYIDSNPQNWEKDCFFAK